MRLFLIPFSEYPTEREQPYECPFGSKRCCWLAGPIIMNCSGVFQKHCHFQTEKMSKNASVVMGSERMGGGEGERQ